MTRLVIHIDKLVLRGLDRHDAQSVSVAIQDELRRLLANPAPESGERPNHALRLPANTDTASLGRSVAGRIAREVPR